MPGFGTTIGLAILILIIAALYASVGQAGASGYLAAMGLLGLDPAMMKPTALALNILVATIGAVQFWGAGSFPWRTFYPFGVLGFPFSLIGGAINLPARIYYPVVGVLLLLAAFQLIHSARKRPTANENSPHCAPPLLPALLTGAAIGFVSGMTGTGGGVFLAPIILIMNWVEVREAAAVSAAYNLLNSIAALAGAYATLHALPPMLPWWLLAAGIGGVFGATIGSRYLPDQVLRYVLVGILIVSGIRLILA